MQKKWTYLLGIIVIGFLAFYFYQKYKIAPDLKIENLSVENLNNEVVNLSSFKGKKTVLCFAASWCGPCRSELKAISSVKESLYRDVEIVVISDEDLETILQFKAQIAYPFVWLRLTKPFNAVDIYSIPTSYFLNTKGEVVKKTVGYLDWKDSATAGHLNKLME